MKPERHAIDSLKICFEEVEHLRFKIGKVDAQPSF